jgi:hypothetical protein
MDGYAAYSEMLRDAVAQQGLKQRQVMDKFQEKLADTERVKQLIDTATEGVGAALGTPAIGMGVKAVTKKAVGLVSDAIGKPEISRQAGEEATPTEEEQYQSNLGQPARTAPEDYGGTPLEDLGPEVQTRLPPTQEQAIQQSRELQAQQRAPTQEDVPEGAGDIQGEMGRPVGGGEGSSEGANAAGDAEQSAQSATDAATSGTAAEGAGLDAGAEAGGAAADAAAGATAADVGVEAGLLSDPLTAIFGLIFGIVTAVAGAEGAASIKNPSVPKIPTIANVSTQFGIGNNGS